jgi:phosphoglycerol transferase MdoB-like AlkP superfamily enzyme
MNRVLNDLGAIKKPFFSTWLTLSSHEPFETPVPVVFKGDEMATKFLNSINYTDAVLGDFIEKARQSSWWNNTLIIIIGDHGHPLPSTGKRADDFRTPMLWLGGAVTNRGTVIDRTVSQLDIAAMLCAQEGWKNDYFPYSKNSLDPEILPWAFFTFNNGFGFVDSSGRLVYDNVGKLPIQQEGNSGAQQIRAGQALQQNTFGDYVNK